MGKKIRRGASVTKTDSPYLIVFSGLPGTGKTTLARALSKKLGAFFLRIDAIETGIKQSELKTDSIEDAGYQGAFNLARENLALGHGVIADCVNPISFSRSAWRQVSRDAHVPCLELELVCSDRVEHQRRVEERHSQDSATPDWQRVLNRHYEPRQADCLELDTARLDISAQVALVTDALEGVLKDFVQGESKMKDPYGAFIDADLKVDGEEAGPLAGRTFAVKDLFHVKGEVTGFGHPLWRERHDPEKEHAPVVRKLLEAGANVRGKSHTDEFAFSLNGENAHYGTPVNPNAKGRIPGGSSSGSAAAVAGELVDFALGTDTGGSVRVPASYCGIYGLRPTHDRIPLEGVLPLAPSFDTIGWFARDPGLLREIGRQILPDWSDAEQGVTKLWIPEDVWDLADDETRDALSPAVLAAVGLTGGADESPLAVEGSLEDWFMPFRTHQGWEIWHTHGDWIQANDPTFGPGIDDRMKWVATITDQERDEAAAIRSRIRSELEARLQPGTLMVLPTAPGPAPIQGQPAEQLESFRFRALQLTGISGLTGVPQLNLPLGKVQDCPVGLSFLTARGGDELLLNLAAEFAGTAEKGLAKLK